MIQCGGVQLALHRSDEVGPPIFMQHGLLGDMAQPAAVFPHGHGFAHHVMECRGHGLSPLADGAQISIEAFTDDLACVIAKSCDAPVVVGGISMGAALALRLAVKRPDLVRGLVLARPAWFLECAPDNMRPNAEVGDLLAGHDPDSARNSFKDGNTAAILAREAPDNMRSLLGFFDRAPQAETAQLLQAISADGPGVDASDLRAIACPVLVLACGEDVIHPVAHAKSLVASIPRSCFHELTPKGRDPQAHRAEFREHLLNFLEKTKE